MLRFAANLGFLFTEHPFLERFAASRRAGFDAVEFASPYEHPAATVAQALHAAGQRCVLFNLPMGDRARGDFGIACRPERVEEFREGVERAIGYARALRPALVNCIAGLAAPGEDAATLRRTLVANLRHAAAALAAEGVGLVIEPINTHDVPGFFVPRCEDGAAIVAEAGHANLGLQCDLYHAAMMGDDGSRVLESLHGVIRHIQFADAPGRGEPGTGTVPLAQQFATIEALGYRGWVSAEYRPTKPTPDTLQWLAAAS